MQNHHYLISTRLEGMDTEIVLAVAATPELAAQQFKALGGRVDREAWVVATLAGKTRTTDGYPCSRSYTAGGQGRLLRVEHHAWSESMTQGVLAFQREATANQEAPLVHRRDRRRP